MKLLLGSNSPRRKELLTQLHYTFETVKIECDEVFPQELPVQDVAGFLSELKAKHFRELLEDEVLLTADTVVAIDNEILGKPLDEEDARKMLQKLSGKWHQVYTAVTFKTKNETLTKTDVADVEFAQLSEEDINFYIQKYHPFDKAGSYGIQEWIGLAKILKIKGSFYTIMGLPTHLVSNFLTQFSIHK